MWRFNTLVLYITQIKDSCVLDALHQSPFKGNRFTETYHTWVCGRLKPHCSIVVLSSDIKLFLGIYQNGPAHPVIMDMVWKTLLLSYFAECRMEWFCCHNLESTTISAEARNFPLSPLNISWLCHWIYVLSSSLFSWTQWKKAYLWPLCSLLSAALCVPIMSAESPIAELQSHSLSSDPIITVTVMSDSDGNSASSRSTIPPSNKLRKKKKCTQQERSPSGSPQAPSNNKYVLIHTKHWYFWAGIKKARKGTGNEESGTKKYVIRVDKGSSGRRACHPKVMSPYDWCIQASRWIPCAFDMFCDVGEVIKVSLLLEEAGSEDEDKDNSEVSKRRKTILDRV